MPGWALFWAATSGLHLDPGDWRGKGRYLPSWQLGEEPVAALAIDLKRLHVKGLTTMDLSRVREGIPAAVS